MAIESLQGIESKAIPFMHHHRAIVDEHVQSTASDFGNYVCCNLEQIAVELRRALHSEYVTIACLT